MPASVNGSFYIHLNTSGSVLSTVGDDYPSNGLQFEIHFERIPTDSPYGEQMLETDGARGVGVHAKIVHAALETNDAHRILFISHFHGKVMTDSWFVSFLVFFIE